MKAIVLAAGVGRRFGKRTANLPKCLIPLNRRGTTLLERYLTAFRSVGIRDVIIVVGHQKEKIVDSCAQHGRNLKIRFIENKNYTLGSILSLARASEELAGGAVIMDADVFFLPRTLKKLVGARGSVFLFDPRSKSTGEEMMLMSDAHNRIRSISKTLDPHLSPIGEATGLFKISRSDAPLLKLILARFVRNGIHRVEYEESYSALMKKRSVSAVSVGKSFWSEMDFEKDLKIIQRFLLRA